eukprot:s3156_g10.t1
MWAQRTSTVTSESLLSAQDCQKNTLCTSTSVAAALDFVSPAIAGVLENRSSGPLCDPKDCHQWWRPKRDGHHQNTASVPKASARLAAKAGFIPPLCSTRLRRSPTMAITAPPRTAESPEATLPCVEF